MKVILPGGSGQVGSLLAQAFQAAGHDVVVFSRNPAPAPWRVVAWDAQTLGEWVSDLDGADAVINLAGRSVNCRYTSANRKRILDSRVDSTRVIGQAIARARRPPSIWLQASTATIYAHRYDAPNDEITGILGGHEPNAPDAWRFSVDVATSWERTANEIETPRTRKVLLRSAMVMSPDHGSVFDVLLRLVRYGLGGQMGNGRQFVSWIHDQDFVRAILWLIAHDDMAGPANLAAPNPLPNCDFMRVLREAWGAPFGLPATQWMLEVGAALLQTETELILKSRCVIPARLMHSGFEFQFKDWAMAANDLCGRWRQIDSGK